MFKKWRLSPGICQCSLVWRFTASASKARELCTSKEVVSAGSLELAARPDPLQACMFGLVAGQLCVLCVLLMLGTITGLANAAFSVGTAEQMLFNHLPTGGDRIIKGQMLLFPRSAASCCLILSIPELHEFCRHNCCWVMLLPTKSPKTKQTLLPLTVGLVFWLWVGGAKLPSMERVLDCCWAAECPLL